MQSKTGWVAHPSNPSFWKIETGRSRVQGYPQVHSEFSYSLSSPVFKKQKQGVGELTQRLKVFGGFPAPTSGGLHQPVTPGPGDTMHSLWAFTHAHTVTYINKNKS